MFNFTDILTSRARIIRNTNVILDETDVASSLTVTRQPGESCLLEVEISAATMPGTVYIDGESFYFAENGIKSGTVSHTTITGITISNITDGQIEIKAVSQTGQPVVKAVQMYGSIPCRLFLAKGRNITIIPGQVQQNRQKLMFAPTAVIKDNDEVYPVSKLPGFDSAKITFVDTIYDFDGVTHHLECDFE